MGEGRTGDLVLVVQGSLPWLFQRQWPWAPIDFPPGAPAPVAELLLLRESSFPGDTCPRLALTLELQSHHLQGWKTLEHSWFNLLFNGETEAHAGKATCLYPHAREAAESGQ